MEHILDSNKFTTLSLRPELHASLDSLAYHTMTPIQKASLPPMLAGRDLIAQSNTGSGKTAAFGIGVLSKIDPKDKHLQALVLCPTRELAEQVAQELRRLARFIENVKILTLCGGTPVKPQVASLAFGAHIVIGTPGRILDLLDRRSLSFKQINTLVLDEADRMLDMGFAEALDAIMVQVPEKRQTLLFSATYPDTIAEISKSFQTNPVNVTIAEKTSHSSIKQHFYEVAKAERCHAVMNLIQDFQPESTLIFCTTKLQCEDIADELSQNGFTALAMHGDFEQKERNEILTRFANKSCSILVATDVAARGLDITDLQCVINYEISRSPEVHVHRIGRTGRAGRQGLALSFFDKKDAYKLKALEEYLNTPIHRDRLVSRSINPALIPKAPMISLCIDAGKKNKLRPGDILGALTGEAKIDAKHIGKITIFDFYSIVAVERTVADLACRRLAHGKIKGRTIKVRLF